MSSTFLSALPLVFVLSGLVLYAVLAGADLGAGFWQLFAGRGRHGEEIREHAHHSMAPVWEANHVWLIFVLTVFWTAYPTAFGSIASTLAIPLFLAGIGIVFRGGGPRDARTRVPPTLRGGALQLRTRSRRRCSRLGARAVADHPSGPRRSPGSRATRHARRRRGRSARRRRDRLSVARPSLPADARRAIRSRTPRPGSSSC